MSISTESVTLDSLIAGTVLPIPVIAGTLALGQDLERGALLGAIKRAIGDADPDVGNTGEGTISGEALGAGSKIGTYVLTCVEAGPPARFEVVDPDGIRLEDAYAEESYAGPVAFLIEAYGAAFVVGDIFTVAVDAGSGYLSQADSGGVDGTEDLVGVLADDTDASLAAKVCELYTGGEFSDAAIGYAVGDDADTWEEQGRLRGIIIRTTVATDGTL